MYSEAIRQRAAKYSFLAMLVNKPNQDKQDQREISKQLDKMLNPYNVYDSDDSSGWDILRKRPR